MTKSQGAPVRPPVSAADVPKTPTEVSASSKGAERPRDAEEKAKSGAAGLVQLATAHCTLFHNADGVPYATFERAGHRECWLIGSKGFEEWLALQFYRQCGQVPAEAAMKAALGTLSGQAKFSGQQRDVHLRVAQHDGAYWVDMCDEEWRAIKVSSEGWQIVERPGVHFVRSMSMRALPIPRAGGDLSKLWQLVNTPESAQGLVLTWILESLRPETPYPLLEMVGEQGTVKSGTQNVIREVIDPNQSNLRAPPKSTDDLAAMAAHNHIVCFENVSHLTDEQQDNLCRLSTGAGFGKRELYTEFDEALVNLKRPVMINGISASVTRADLLDRTISISLPRVQHRKSNATVQKLLDGSKGEIFGGLLDLMVATLKVLATNEVNEAMLPRMADFAQLGEAVYTALDRPPGSFLADYNLCRQDGIQRTLESSPVAQAVMELLDDEPDGYLGSYKALLYKLERYRPGGDAWPRTPKGLADSLRRIAPALREIRISVTASNHHTKHGYTCEIRRLPKEGDLFGDLDDQGDHGSRLTLFCNSRDRTQTSIASSKIRIKKFTRVTKFTPRALVHLRVRRRTRGALEVDS